MIECRGCKMIKEQKNNTRDSNVVPHRSTNLARQCLTSLSRREAVLSLWYGRSCRTASNNTIQSQCHAIPFIYTFILHYNYKVMHEMPFILICLSSLLPQSCAITLKQKIDSTLTRFRHRLESNPSNVTFKSTDLDPFGASNAELGG